MRRYNWRVPARGRRRAGMRRYTFEPHNWRLPARGEVVVHCAECDRTVALDRMINPELICFMGAWASRIGRPFVDVARILTDAISCWPPQPHVKYPDDFPAAPAGERDRLAMDASFPSREILLFPPPTDPGCPDAPLFEHYLETMLFVYHRRPESRLWCVLEPDTVQLLRVRPWPDYYLPPPDLQVRGAFGRVFCG